VTLRIVVDRVLCQGHGVCESEAPDVFAVGDDCQVVVHDESPPEALRSQVEMAVKYCPTHALTLEDT
jgi:sterol 14-demethylase